MANWDFDYDQGAERETWSRLDEARAPLEKEIRKLRAALDKAVQDRNALRMRLDDALDKLDGKSVGTLPRCACGCPHWRCAACGETSANLPNGKVAGRG